MTYLDSLPSYVFWDLDARRRAHRATGRTLIDLGIGSPDQPIPAPIIDAMTRAVSDRSLSGYPHFRVHPQLADASSAYMADRFGVHIDPSRELIALAGSKEGLAELVLAHCSPGDVVLVPEVHYPVYARAPQLVGAEPVFVPFRADGSGQLDLERVSPGHLSRARLLIINYPGNPTTSTASLADLSRLVEFCRVHELLLVSDLAYSELSFDGYRVPSVLEVPGAREVAVELHTCSKSFNMAGLRIAFAAGCVSAIDALDRYRSNVGYGVSTFSQLAGAAAFACHREVVPPIVAEYRTRRDALVSALQGGGWNVVAPDATMYLWLDVPAGYGDWEWVDALIEATGVVVTPGIAFGAAGSGKFRVSLVQPAEVLSDAGARIAAFAGSSER
jgi:LL-diaminopimelate aminotransferase